MSDASDKAARRRAAADRDDELAAAKADECPPFAEYLSLRAAWRRRLARDEEAWDDQPGA